MNIITRGSQFQEGFLRKKYEQEDLGEETRI